MPADTAAGRGTVALVEDDALMGAALAHRLGIEGYSVAWAKTAGEGEGLFEGAERPDILLCDLRLPDSSGEELFLRLRSRLGDAPVILMTAFGEIDQAVRLVRSGADDFLTKPFEVADLLARMERLLARRLPPVENAILGRSAAIRRVEATLRRAAAVDSSVLLLGESGVGKEVAARLLHALSPASSSPFVAVNCAAIPAELMESELLGHERGAFTGAATRHAGYAERARGGVLLLDEVADLPPPLQPKLLRLLEAREFTRVGGRERIPFEARVVAATNADLDARAQDGRFRQDLLYRLDVIRVEIPPLRTRRDDILPLARAFLAACAERFGRELRGFDEEAGAALAGHRWPGNARELRNRVERAAVLADGPWLSVAQLFPDLRPAAMSGEAPLTLAVAVAAAERRAIGAALDATGWDVAAAAERLGVGRSTLFDKLKRLGLARPADPAGRTE
jgi:two-component system response regulator HydG